MLEHETEKTETQAFVIVRYLGDPEDPDTIKQYLGGNKYSWVESGAAAKRYYTEEEAESDREHSAHMESDRLFVLDYDPVKKLEKGLAGAEIRRDENEALD